MHPISQGRDRDDLGADGMTTLPRADAARIASDIDALRALTVAERPYTRRSFTPVYDEGRSWLAGAMAGAALDTSIDAAGNLVAVHRAGTSGPRPTEAVPDGAAGPSASASVMIGSHIDTVPDGGAYDGVAGIAAGLEVVRLLHEAAIALPLALEVVDFLAEEPSEFGISCIGSRGMVGRLSREDLERRDSAGTRLRDAIRDVGGRPEVLGAPLRERGSVRAYLELHIEQGRLLERAGRGLGIVTGIVGIRRYEVRIAGAPAHAGTTPMDERRDALAGAAELILAVERLARVRARGGHFVGTVGKLAHAPNASNVVSGQATVTVELRAVTDEALDEAELELDAEAGAISRRRGLELALARVSRTAPVAMDAGLRGLLAQAASDSAAETLELASGGGHDAGHVAALAPAAMVFIPCRDGVSHAPAESASPEHVALGTDVLLRTILKLAEEP
jgi:N-carbamoyl-L-amino-acid hydrolase